MKIKNLNTVKKILDVLGKIISIGMIVISIGEVLQETYVLLLQVFIKED